LSIHDFEYMGRKFEELQGRESLRHDRTLRLDPAGRRADRLVAAHCADEAEGRDWIS
jgi:hypothetical protein